MKLIIRGFFIFRNTKRTGSHAPVSLRTKLFNFQNFDIAEPNIVAMIL
jgi:hypothetical protein